MNDTLLNGKIIASMVGFVFFCGTVIGISAAPAAGAILICAMLCFVTLVRSKTIPLVVLTVLVFIFYHFMSGIIFGGFEAIDETNLIGWISGEGRVFLYYWPFLFAVLFIPKGSRYVDASMSAVLNLLVVILFFIVMLNAFLGVSVFGSHHAAGAFCATLFIYHFHAWVIGQRRHELLFLLLSTVTLIGTNSRTSLGAAFLALILFYLLAGRVRGMLGIALFCVAGAIVMFLIFPEQFLRIESAANVETWSFLLKVFFNTALYGGVELSDAWSATNYFDADGNANVIIRGYLWGRAFFEGSQSPFFGIGFGRFNDVGREFVGVPSLFYPVAAAERPSAGILTAHNTFFQIYCELGLFGLSLMSLILYQIWKSLKVETNNTKWQVVGQSCLICILIMGQMQHSFGAPIYGISIFFLIGISLRLCQNGVQN